MSFIQYSSNNIRRIKLHINIIGPIPKHAVRSSKTTFRWELRRLWML